MRHRGPLARALGFGLLLGLGSQCLWVGLGHSIPWPGENVWIASLVWGLCFSGLGMATYGAIVWGDHRAASAARNCITHSREDI